MSMLNGNNRFKFNLGHVLTIATLLITIIGGIIKASTIMGQVNVNTKSISEKADKELIETKLDNIEYKIDLIIGGKINIAKGE